MNYSFGDIVVVPFPFVSASGEPRQKARPACVVSSKGIKRRYDDVMLAAITSKIPKKIMELELVIKTSPENSLAVNSILRLDFLMTIPGSLISRKIGELSKNQIKTAHDLILKNFEIDS
jgi:mRNA interferase MazF